MLRVQYEVYQDTACYDGNIDHAVVIVGYQLVSNVPYWIICNSWGPRWVGLGFEVRDLNRWVPSCKHSAVLHYTVQYCIIQYSTCPVLEGQALSGHCGCRACVLCALCSGADSGYMKMAIIAPSATGSSNSNPSGICGIYVFPCLLPHRTSQALAPLLCFPPCAPLPPT